MMRAGGISIALLPLMLAGCAGPSLLLLADEDATTAGELAVIDEKCGNPDGSTIAGSFTRTKLSGCAPRPKGVGEGGVKPDERSLLDNLPPPPARFTMYFIPDTTVLAPGSEGMIDALAEHFKARPGAELEIIGHTDTVGSDTYNQDLSQKRADEIKGRLVELGFPPEVITTTGRGEKELRFDTPNDTEYGGNRRVEIIVR